MYGYVYGYGYGAVLDWPEFDCWLRTTVKSVAVTIFSVTNAIFLLGTEVHDIYSIE